MPEPSVLVSHAVTFLFGVLLAFLQHRLAIRRERDRHTSEIRERDERITDLTAQLALARTRIHEFDAVDSTRVGLRDAAAPLLAHLDDIIACCRLCQPTQSGATYLIQHWRGIETASVGLEELLDPGQLREFRELRERLANDPNHHAKQVAERAQNLRTFLARL